MRIPSIFVAVSAALAFSMPFYGCRKLVIIPPSPPVIDVGDADDDCARACSRIASVHCAEGLNSACGQACREDQAQGAAAQLDVGCVLDAGTLDALRACGVRCR